jgi:hypothetical protein
VWREFEPVRIKEKLNMKLHWRQSRQEKIIFRSAKFEVVLEYSVRLELNDQGQGSHFHSVMVKDRNI